MYSKFIFLLLKNKKFLELNFFFSNLYNLMDNISNNNDDMNNEGILRNNISEEDNENKQEVENIDQINRNEFSKFPLKIFSDKKNFFYLYFKFR